MEWRSTFPTTIYLLETRILVCFWAPQADFSPLRGALHVFCIFKYIFTSKNPVKLDWSLYPVNLLCFFKYPVNLARLPPYPNQRGSMLFSCFLLDLTPMPPHPAYVAHNQRCSYFGRQKSSIWIIDSVLDIIILYFLLQFIQKSGLDKK